MKLLSTYLIILIAGLLTGCATTGTRIDQNKALFNTYSPGEQGMIRTQQIAVGFDQEMVRMALGDPSRETKIDTAAGKSVAWEYRQIRPSLGLSVGGGIGTGGTGVGVRPDRSKLLKHITFDRQTSKVTKIESYN